MTAAALILVALVQTLVAWSLRSGWVSFDGYALLRRAAEQPFGDPFHFAVPTVFASAHSLLGPHGFSPIDSATFVSCFASGITVAATAAWCHALGARVPIAIIAGLIAAWTPATAHAALGLEVNSLHMAACAVSIAVAARYSAAPTLLVLGCLILTMLTAVLMHVGSLALIPGWTWFALRKAPTQHRRLAVVVGVALLAALIVIAQRPFKMLGADSNLAPANLTIGDWIWTTIARPRATGGVLFATWEWTRNFFGLIGVPALLASFLAITKPRAFRPIILILVLPTLVFIGTGTSWLGLTLPLVTVLMGPVAAELTQRRHGLAIALLSFVMTFGYAAEVGPGGAGYRLRHFSADPLSATADALAVMLPRGAVLIAGNSSGPLRHRGIPGIESVAEMVMEGGGRGRDPLTAVEARVIQLRADGYEVWISKDALDYLEACGVEQVTVVARIDPTTIRRAGPDEARIARWR